MKYLFLILFSLNMAYGFQEVIRFNKGKVDHYINAYSEGDKFFLDHIIIKAGKLQELKSRNIYNTEKELIRALSKFSKKNKSRFIQKNTTTTETTDVIWTASKEWDLEWEREFAKWIEENLTEDFFVDYNIKTDCADAVLALRWIFARIYGLPAANTLAGSGLIFSHESFKSEWQNLKRAKNWFEDEVFLEALNYLMLHAYTGTLNIDGYPIELTKDSFLVGTFHLDGGHAMTISEIDYDQKLSAPIWKLSSTVPMKVRKLYKEIMVDSVMTDRESGGLFRMRWPIKTDGKWSLVPKTEMPLYSLEQYEDEFTEEFSHFTIALINKLGIDFDPEKIIGETVNNISNSLEARVKIVEDAFEFCSLNDCREGTMNYEEYSTPTRDGRLTELFVIAQNLVKNFTDFVPNIENVLIDKLNATIFSVAGHSRSLMEWKVLLENYALSYDPFDPLPQRWALSESDIQRTYESRLESYLDKRDKLIELANDCRINPSSCDFASDTFKKHDTYKFDQEMKLKIFIGYNFYKSKFNQFKDADKMSKLPYLLSDPRLSIEKRKAEDINAQDYETHIIKATFLMELDDNKILADGKIFDLKTNQFINEIGFKSTLYLKNLKKIILQDENDLKILDTDGSLISSIKFDSNHDVFELLSEKFLLINSRLNNRSELKIFDLTDNFKVVFIESHTNYYSNYHDGVNYSLIDEKYKNIYHEYFSDGVSYFYDQEGELTVLKEDFEDVVINSKNLIKLSDNKIFIESFENNKTCEFEFKEDVEYVYTHLENENLVSIETEDDEKTYLLDISDCEPRILLVKSAHIDLFSLREETIITLFDSDSSSETYIYKNKKLFQLTKGGNLTDFKDDEAYIFNYSDTSDHKYYKINILSGEKTILDPNRITFSCYSTAIDCYQNDLSFENVMSLNSIDDEFQMYNHIQLDNKTLFNFYRVNNNEYFESSLELQTYNANRMEKNTFILYRKK